MGEVKYPSSSFLPPSPIADQKPDNWGTQMKESIEVSLSGHRDEQRSEAEFSLLPGEYPLPPKKKYQLIQAHIQSIPTGSATLMMSFRNYRKTVHNLTCINLKRTQKDSKHHVSLSLQAIDGWHYLAP